MRKHARRNGVILVAVLWLLVFLAALAVALRMVLASSAQSAVALESSAMIRALAAGGLELAAARIRATEEGDRQQTAFTATYDNGEAALSVTAVSEGGRVDLNVADSALLTAVFMAGGLNRDAATVLTQRIIDWRDGDIQRTGAGGAEGPAYDAAGKPYRPRNGAFQSLEETGQILGLPPNAQAALMRYATVSSGLATVRPDLVPPELVQHVGGLSAAMRTNFQLFQARRLSATELLDRTQGNGAFAPTLPSTWRVQVTVALSNGRRATYDAVIMVSAQDQAPYRVMEWRRAPSPLSG